MGLIEDYESLIVSIKNISTEIPELQEQITVYEREIAEAQNNKAQLQMERSHQSTSLRESKLQELTAELCSKISYEQSQITQKLSEIDSEFSKASNAIKNEEYRDKFVSKYALLTKIQQTLDAYRCRQNIPEELEQIVASALAGQTKYTDEQLLDLVHAVERSSTSLEDSQEGIGSDVGSKIVDFISLKSIQNSKMSDSSKFYCYFGYLAGLIALCFVSPLIPISVVGVTSILCYNSYNSRNRNLLDFILPFSRLSDGYNYLSTQIEDKVTKLCASALQRTQQKYAALKAPLEQKLIELKEEYNQAPQKVLSSISDEDLQQAVNKKYEDLLAGCDKRIASAERQIKRTNAFIANNQKRLPKLKEKRTTMLLDIKDAYLNPKEAGTSKTLVKSFFLGIDDTQGGLIEFRYEGHTTLIVYKGETCRVNKDLISMMLMQILSTMSMTVLDIHLVDLKSAGTDYAVFFRKELQDRMHLYATNEDVKQAIDTLHEMLIIRTQDILTEAESLQAYNEKMLANKSLPMEYVLFFMQDPTLDQMEDQALQQLLYNGPTVGIIPIIFINHKDINYTKDLKREEAETLAAFYQAFEGSIFIFDGAKSDLIQQNKVLPSILAKIQKGIK